jgi:hypothetical protein
VSDTVDTQCARQPRRQGQRTGGGPRTGARARGARGVGSSTPGTEFAQGHVHRVMRLSGLHGSYVQHGELWIAVCDLGVGVVDPVQVGAVFRGGCPISHRPVRVGFALSILVAAAGATQIMTIKYTDDLPDLHLEIHGTRPSSVGAGRLPMRGVPRVRSGARARAAA